MARSALAWRLAGGFAMVGTLALAGTSLYLDAALRTDAANHADSESNAKLAAIRVTVATLNSLAEVRAAIPRIEAIFLGHPEQVALLADASGAILVAVPASAASLPITWERAKESRDAPLSGRPYRWTASIVKTAGGATVHTLIGQDMSAPQAIFDAHLQRVWESLLAGTLLLGAAAWAITRRGLAPLHTMAARIAVLDATRLSSRLDTGPLPRDLVPFAEAINVALVRLEESFSRLSRFAADLAHDLRTPISNLRGEAEVALSRPRTPQEYQDVLGSAIEEYERLTNMIEAMLFLARADRAELAMQPERVDLGAQSRELAEFLEPLATARNLDVKVSGDAEAFVDRTLIRRALLNLLSNALQHGTAGTEVEVTLRRTVHFVEVAVENRGLPMEDKVRAQVFNRFFRGDSARADSATRTGLGLAIVYSIVQLHRGDVFLDAAPPGFTRFTMRLPV